MKKTKAKRALAARVAEERRKVRADASQLAMRLRAENTRLLECGKALQASRDKAIAENTGLLGVMRHAERALDDVWRVCDAEPEVAEALFGQGDGLPRKRLLEALRACRIELAGRSDNTAIRQLSSVEAPAAPLSRRPSAGQGKGK